MLEEEFAHPFMVVQAHIDTLLKLPNVKPNDASGLRSFSNELHGAVSVLANSSHHYELSSSGIIKQLLGKLPANLRDKWGLKFRFLSQRMKDRDHQHQAIGVSSAMPTAQSKGMREMYGFVTVRANRRSQEIEKVFDREAS